MIVSNVDGKEVSYSSLSYAPATEEENRQKLSEDSKTTKNALIPNDSNVKTLGDSANQKIKEKYISPVDSQKKENKKAYESDNFEEEENTNDYKLSTDGSSSSSINSFESLTAAMGINSDKITKTQLLAFLQKLSSSASKDDDNNQEIAFIKRIIANFDTLSTDGEYITSLNKVNEPQDYKTVTQEQVTPPVDIRI